MVRLGRFFPKSRVAATQLSLRTRAMLTLSNVFMLMGAILLLYVGGIYATAEYGIYAARGDTDEPAPQPVSPDIAAPAISLRSLPFLPQESAVSEPVPFTPPVNDTAPATSLPNPDGRVTSILPDTLPAEHNNTITRIIIPSIDVDSKVVPVGWEIQELKGQKIAVWQVAEYAVGHHVNSANPGEHDNIVLAGHVGGYGKVFKDLIKLKVGDTITIYSAGEAYQYTIHEKLLVTEEGVSAEQQAENARFIAPTTSEMLTLVTCWPNTGPHKYTQRIIIRALPAAQDTSRG